MEVIFPGVALEKKTFGKVLFMEPERPNISVNSPKVEIKFSQTDVLYKAEKEL